MTIHWYRVWVCVNGRAPCVFQSIDLRRAMNAARVRAGRSWISASNFIAHAKENPQ